MVMTRLNLLMYFIILKFTKLMFKSLLQLHPAAPHSPGTPEGLNGYNSMLKTGQPLFLFCKIRPGHTEVFHFCLFLGCCDSRFFVLFSKLLTHGSVCAVMAQGSWNGALAAKEGNSFSQAFLSTKGLWQASLLLVSSPKSASLSWALIKQGSSFFVPSLKSRLPLGEAD